MSGRDEFLKHLRSTHFVLVISSIVIVVGLSGASEIYSRAQDQLDDVLLISERLTLPAITEAIREQAPELRTWAAPRATEAAELGDLMEEALAEHLDEVAAEIGYLSVWEYAGDSTIEEFWAETSFFHSHGALLSDGGEPRAYLAFGDHIDARNIGGIEASLDRLLAFDTLYTSPQYFPHAQGDTLFRDGRLWDESELATLAETYREPRLTGTVLGVRLTTAEDRAAHARAEQAASEDPEAWSLEAFEPDAVLLECRLSGKGDRPATTFRVELPVMFTEESPSFVADALRAFAEADYYPRHLSGAASFAALFPDLHELTRDLQSLGTEDLRNYMRNQARRGDAPISLLGIQVRQELIEVWGVLAMLVVQLYFCLHFRTFTRMQHGGADSSFPWIGTYDDRIARVVFRLSLMLPLAVCLYLAWRQGPAPSAVAPTTWVFGAASLGLYLWIEATARAGRRSRALRGAPGN